MQVRNRIRASIPLNMKPFQGLTKVRQRRRNLRVFNLEFKLQLISSCHDIIFETQADPCPELDAYDSEIFTLGVAGADFCAHGFGQSVLRRY